MSPYWIFQYVGRQCQAQSLGKVIDDFLDTYASTDEQVNEFIPQLMAAARRLGYSLDEER